MPGETRDPKPSGIKERRETGKMEKKQKKEKERGWERKVERGRKEGKISWKTDCGGNCN